MYFIAISAFALICSAASAAPGAPFGNMQRFGQFPQSSIRPLTDGFAIIDTTRDNGPTEPHQPLITVGAAVTLDGLLPSPGGALQAGERP